MYTPQFPDPWDDVIEDDTTRLEADLAVEQTRAKKLTQHLENLKAIEEFKAQQSTAQQSTAQPATAPNAPGDPDKLSQLLEQLDPNDIEGAARAVEAAGFERVDALNQSWRGGRLQFSGKQTQDIEAAYADIDQAVSFADFQNRLAAHGLIEGGAV